MAELRRFLAVDELAQQLRMDRKTLYRHIAKGHLNGAVVRIGRRIFVDMEAFDKLHREQALNRAAG